MHKHDDDDFPFPVLLMGTATRVVSGNFLLMDQTDFLLMDGTNFLLTE